MAGFGVALVIWMITHGAAASPAVVTIPLPNIPSRIFRLTDFGAIGNGKTNNAPALGRAIAACTKAGGGTVDIPPGRYLTRPFTLTSNLNLKLEPGASLLLSTDPADYALPENKARPCIEAADCHDVSITGGGTIDGLGGSWWPRYVKTYTPPAGTPAPVHRPYLLVFTRCARVLVQGVTLTNSPSFHLVPSQCQDVHLDNVRIIAPASSPNTDGIDPSGWNYLITNCMFDVGDDCIALKPTKRIDPAQPSCRNFTIRHCVFLHGHGLSIGGQTPGGLEGLTVTDCTFDGTQAGIRMKASRDTGGLVENLTYERLTMKNVKVPIFITSYYPRPPDDIAGDPAQSVTATTPIWRHICISDVTITGSPEAGRILGLAEMPVSDILLTNVRITAGHGLTAIHTRNIRFVHSAIHVGHAPSLITQDADISGLEPAP